ncbi:hypothetical protein LIER_18945 [Lithospermum erythrorhizon]|uniref:Uncharacterized protein n=1 Tax=Lithospermum erythrorhizon TaxID=34254 RepID=A0AAV3QIV2_LITER
MAFKGGFVNDLEIDSAGISRLEGKVKHLEDEASQHPKKQWAAVKNYKQSSEFEASPSSVVECFKKSPEFLDVLGINVVYGVCSFVRKYNEKYFALITRSFRKVTILLGSRSFPWMPPLKMRKMKKKPLLQMKLP